MNLKPVLASLIIFLSMTALANSEQIGDGETLVKAMHARYEKTWYDTVTFTQKSTTYNPDGTTKVETWYEAASLPGNCVSTLAPRAMATASFFPMAKPLFSRKASRPALALT